MSNEFLLLAEGNSQVGTPDAGNHHWEVLANVGNVERAVLSYPVKPW